MTTLLTCARCGKRLDTDAPARIDDALQRLLAINARGWKPGDPICAECLAPFVRVREELESRFPHLTRQDLRIIPTPMRLDACDEWRGKGVTIAFLDSGFHAHPDLTQPRNRILEYVNIAGDTKEDDLITPQLSSWHGM
ncbi:MAG TPA: hypothetical protein VG778_08685, partial [Blastocatellia bacterium]|nr:hypothetical protein [Blastocatellia bacterium]